METKTEQQRFNADCRRYGRPGAVRRQKQRKNGQDARATERFSKDVDRQFRRFASSHADMDTAVSGWGIGG